MGNIIGEELERELNESLSAQQKNHNQTLAETLGKKLITLVVIGKTGAGKTTWINAFISSLAGRTYREDRLVAISQTLENMKQVCNIREFKNYQIERVSCQTEAQTTSCTMYRVITDKFLISISDTPGLDESKMEDSSHIQKIAEHVAILSQIDAIVYVHNDSEVRASESLKQMIHKYFNMLSPEVVTQKLVVCLTHLFNVDQGPKSVETLRQLKIISDMPATKYFAFQNDNWLDHKVVVSLLKPNVPEARLNMLLDNNSYDWDYNMKQYKEFLEAVSGMDPPASTEKMFIVAKLKEASEDFIRMTMENLRIQSELLEKNRKTQAHLVILLRLLDNEASRHFVLSFPIGGIFAPLGSLEKSEDAVIYSVPKKTLCKEISKEQISTGFLGLKGDDCLKCCGAKKSEHVAIDSKFKVVIPIVDPLLLGFTIHVSQVEVNFNRLVIIYLKGLLQEEEEREARIINIIKSQISDGKSLERLRDVVPGKEFISTIREKFLALYTEFQTELESSVPCKPSPGCFAVLSAFIIQARMKLFKDLEVRFAMCKPYEIKKKVDVMEEGGSKS